MRPLQISADFETALCDSVFLSPQVQLTPESDRSVIVVHAKAVVTFVAEEQIVANFCLERLAENCLSYEINGLCRQRKTQKGVKRFQTFYEALKLFR